MINLDYFIQYENSPFFREWLSDLEFLDNQYNMDDLKTVYDLDTATGYQLDFIAKLVGFSRPIRFIGDTGVWRTSVFRQGTWGGDGVVETIGLDDVSFRKILKVYCSQLNAPITINNIYRFLINAFGQYDYEVISGGLEITIRLPSDIPTNDLALILSGILIPPQGVEIIYELLP